MSLITRILPPDEKGTKLTFQEMDNNLYYLQSLGVSSLTFSANTLTITNPTGGTKSVIINTGNTFTGGTVSGATQYTNGLSANTISATTYQNLPLDIEVTGGTYSDGIVIFTNNTGGTFNVIGFYTGETSYVNSLTTGSGLSADTTTGNITIINTDPDQVVVLSNGTNIDVTGTYPNFTIDVTGLTDFNTYTTGFTYSNNTFTILDNSGNTFDSTFTDVTGLTINGDLTVIGTTSSDTISATTYQNLPDNVTGNYLPLSGGTVTGQTSFTNGLNTNSISATTYQNLPTDVRVTGGTYLNNTFTYTNNTGGTFNVLFNSVTGLTVNGNLHVTGNTNIDGDLTANTISVSALDVNGLNITGDTYVTGLTFNTGNYDLTIGRNDGVTFTDSLGILGGDLRVTGGTYDIFTGDATFTNNSGATFIVSGFLVGYTDLLVTGATYNNNTFTFKNSSGDTFDVSFNTVTGLTSTGTIQSSILSATTYQNLPDNVTGNYLPLSGGTVTGSTQFTNGLITNTISATTLTINGVNITGDTYVTGGTYSNGTTTFTNTSGGTFNVTGFTQPFSGGSGNCITDLYVTNLHGCSPITIYDSIKSTGSTVSGLSSFSFGFETSATTNYSHAEGFLTLASGFSSHAEGQENKAIGNFSHVEGTFSQSIGLYSHAEGQSTTTIGDASHAEGISTMSVGNNSHAEGVGTISLGDGSHAEGFGTVTDGNYQHATGLWNLTGDTTQGAFIIGNGIDTDNRSNLLFAANSGVTVYGDFIANTISATTYQNLPDNVTGNYLPLSGGTVTGSTDFTNGLTANTISATTYQNLPLDIRVTGGTYSTGTITFTNNQNNTFSVTGLTEPFTGGSGNCITDLYTSNIHSCSPLNINPLDEGNVYFGSTSGITIDVTNSRLGVGTTNPQTPLEVMGTNGVFSYDPTSSGGRIQVSGSTGLPRIVMTIPSYLTNLTTGVSVGIRSWDDLVFSGYGKVGDSFLYAGQSSNGLNVINDQGISSEDYVRFYAGQDASLDNTPDIHIQGSGSTRGNVGIGTATPTERLDVSGKTKTLTLQVTSGAVPGYVLTSDVSGNATWQLGGSGTFTGGTVVGPTIFTNGLSSTTISATTYLNLPTDIRVTGATYSNNTFTHRNNTGGTYTVLFNTLTGLTVNGNLTVTGTTSSNTISATTYQNLPTDIRVTGATYSNNTFTYRNNTGGTFNVLFNTVTGLTSTGNISSSTISATTYQNLPTDIRVTGATYSNNTFTHRNNTGGTYTVLFNTVTGLTSTGTISSNTISATTYQNLPTDVRVTGGTYSNGTTTFTNNTGGTFNVTGFTTGATITNNTNNYLLTATGTANSINGEGNATFDGTTLDLKKNSSNPNIILSDTGGTTTDAFIRFESTSAGTPSFAFGSDKSESNKLKITYTTTSGANLTSTEFMGITTGGTMTIGAYDSVQINTSSSSGRVFVTNGNTSPLLSTEMSQYSNFATITANQGTSTANEEFIIVNESFSGSTIFRSNTSEDKIYIYPSTQPMINGDSGVRILNSLLVNGTVAVGTVSGSGVAVYRNATTGVLSTTSSDIRLKQNISQITGATDIIKNLTGVYFDWKDTEDFKSGDNSRQIGLIAQDVEPHLPEAVVLNGNKDYKTVKYSEMVSVLIEGIKEQQQQIELLKTEIQDLKNRISNIGG